MMKAQAEADRKQLTPYEAEQVQEIAAWKSEPPNPLGELWKMITLPGAKLVKKVIPDALVKGAIEGSYKGAEMLAWQEDLKVRAGVADLDELKDRPLEECDGLAKQVGATAMILGTVEGAATGAGGVWTTLLDVPLLFVLSMRTILRIGHCYGYKLDDLRGQCYVLGVLIAAVSGSLEIRRQRLHRLREIEDLLIEETQEEIVVEELTALLFQLELFEEVPGIGAISGGLLNLTFLRRVERTARRTFQERWLRDNGKVHVIEPVEAHPRVLAPGWSGALGRAAYSGCYSLGFGVALPVCVAAELIRPVGNALTQGIRGSASALGQSLGRILPRGRAAAAPEETAPSLAPA
jgi:hypothetical protein